MQKVIKKISANKVEYFLFFLILLAGFVVRLWKIDNPLADWHSWRQADTASVSRIYVEEGIDLLRPRYHDISNTQTGFENPQGWRFVEFPIYNGLHAALFKAYPAWPLERWGRLLSAISSLVSVVFIYLIGKRFLGKTGGLLAGFFFAVLPFNIFFSRVILPEPMAVTFVTGALWFFILWTDHERLWQILLSGILFSLAILVKPFTAFYGLVMLYLAREKLGLKRLLSRADLWVFAGVVLAPVLFWRGWMAREEFLRGIPHAEWVFNGDNIRFRPSWWGWMFGERLGKLILGGWALVPFVFGLVDKRKGGYSWFFHVLFLSQILYFAVVATANVRHDYYQTLSIPAVALVLAAGFLAIWNLQAFQKDLRRLALVGATFFGLAFSFWQVKEFYKVNHPEIIRAGAAVQRLTPKDALVIAPYNGDTAFLYQTNRRGWPFVTWPMPKMIELGAEYYVSVNFDEQTKAVMEQYQVLEKTDEYVVVKLQ